MKDDDSLIMNVEDIQDESNKKKDFGKLGHESLA